MSRPKGSTQNKRKDVLPKTPNAEKMFVLWLGGDWKPRELALRVHSVREWMTWDDDSKAQAEGHTEQIGKTLAAAAVANDVRFLELFTKALADIAENGPEALHDDHAKRLLAVRNIYMRMVHERDGAAPTRADFREALLAEWQQSRKKGHADKAEIARSLQGNDSVFADYALGLKFSPSRGDAVQVLKPRKK